MDGSSLAAGATATGAASSADVAGMPWAFSQSRPLFASDLIKEAESRGFDLELSVLRELYRHNLVVPFVYASARQVGPIPEQVAYEPRAHNTSLLELRHARDRGRLSDLAALPFKPWLRFDHEKGDPRDWWNGLLYSRYQVLVLPELKSVLSKKRHRRSRNGKLLTRLPKPDKSLLGRAVRFRTIAVVLTAIEARYLPKLDPEWVRVVNTDEAEWRKYRSSFDPVAMSRRLRYPAAQAREDAEWLLLQAHHVDPTGSSWSQLMRRAPRRAWDRLKDAALLAMDYREAAELLLLFYEDLVAHGAAEPLPELPRIGGIWHPLVERLSYRKDTLDQDLMELGVSPHPRIVLVVEGDTEQVHAPLVWKTLDYPDAPELMRILKLGGVDVGLQKVAAVTAAPLVGGAIGGPEGRFLIKPPTRLLVAVDPEGRQFGDPGKVARTRSKIIREIKDVLRAQGVTDADPNEIDELVKIRTWSASCYEFTHFTDEELADGIMAIHATINGLTRKQLIKRIASERARRKDIKEVWSQWDYKPSKVDLARALWPTLERKIQQRLADARSPTPEIAEIVYEAYITAQQWRYSSFSLGSAENSTEG
jgi:hypothetical protein